MVTEITPAELQAAARGRQRGPLVLDVREGWELEVASIPDVLHIPMNEIPARLGELDRERGDRRHVPFGWPEHAGGAISRPATVSGRWRT